MSLIQVRFSFSLFLPISIDSIAPLQTSLNDGLDTRLFLYLSRQVPICLQIPNEVYHPPVEAYRGCCRQIKKEYQRNNSLHDYISILEGDKDGKQSKT